ncbi:unnamed protein product [Tilletia controversa]|uniref:Glycosyl transferase CAP10 domain-containing protein n=3 Tax=Tilletia TaxID=13289 RepID=A0A8X7MXS9_9BASI|nr:hypothetical protein CF336_g2870 [Tilletia laevis]KAE8200702.1 hypothetical protein CF328_g2893 [Tilletia controversa]KAE8262434.1 hypothetical protein A4X03_0g2449 [Tilletia caries]KAE8205681.1 hypothetical protein CF335_g2216 [Tilletia laevis]KAE8253015.1 hypothetical protein A4X06_0g1767 [Tilletia controversa]
MVTYSRVNSSETSLPTTSAPSTSSGPFPGSGPKNPLHRLVRRARQRWVTTLLALFMFLVVLNLVFGDGGSIGSIGSTAKGYAKLLTPSTWRKPNAYAGEGLSPVASSNVWVNGSGRNDLHYDSPFNRDDLTLTEDECDVIFPGLWKDIDRSVDYYTKHPFTKEYLESSCDDNEFSQLRVVIFDNRLYVKMYKQSDFTRTQTTLALLHQSIVTSRERLPNVEFCMDLQDWGHPGKFSLDRAPDQQDVWLMPDYAFYTWKEHVGAYKEFREASERVEKEIGWEGKKNKLFWRGSMKVGRADREALVAAASGHDWSDVLPLDWTGDRHEWVSMADHCRWKFHGFPEGNSYSGRLRYLQHCRSVIVTHEPRWIQHWTHLYNANTSSPDQNIVFVPPAPPGTEGTPVKDDDNAKVRYDTTWTRLPEVMEELLHDDAKTKRIADNQVAFFRERYVSPASAACYWRKALKGFAKTQRFTVDLSGKEISYEDHMLRGFPLWPEPVPQ